MGELAKLSFFAHPPGTFKLARASPFLRNWARQLSWTVGFLLFLSHLFLQLEIGFEFARIFTTIITASGVHWHVTKNTSAMISIAFSCICGLVSCTSIARSPQAWKLVGLINVVLQLAVCVALLATASGPRSFSSLFSTRKTVPLFKNKVWNLLFAWAYTTLVSGSEVASHMAEETKHAATTVPQSMFFTSVFCGVWQLLTSVCLALTITPMRGRVPTGWPIIDAVFWHCPKPVAQFITISLAVTAFIANVAQFLATSRFFWALARDKALPKAKFLQRVTRDRRPLRATLLMLGLQVTIALTGLEPSGLLLNAASKASTLFIMVAYLTPLIIYVSSPKGVYDRDGSNMWTTRGFSKPLACISIGFLTLEFMIQSGPVGTPISIKTFPIAPFILLGAVGLSSCLWYLYGRAHFVGPIKSLTTWTVGYEVEIPRPLPKSINRLEKNDGYEMTKKTRIDQPSC